MSEVCGALSPESSAEPQRRRARDAGVPRNRSRDAPLGRENERGLPSDGPVLSRWPGDQSTGQGTGS